MTPPATPSADVIPFTQDDDDAVIAKAIKILSRRIARAGVSLSSPSAVKAFLTLKLAQEEREVFAVLWLDVKNRLIAYEELSHGTLTHTSVYPREVVKAALKNNAAGALICHNHPSGQSDASSADQALTTALKSALALVDVRVLDHIIVAGTETMSFAERGLL